MKDNKFSEETRREVRSGQEEILKMQGSRYSS